MPKTVDYEREMEKIIALLYFDPHAGGYNPDKEWDAETIEQVAAVVRGTFEFTGEGKLTRIKRFPPQPPKTRAKGVANDKR